MADSRVNKRNVAGRVPHPQLSARQRRWLWKCLVPQAWAGFKPNVVNGRAVSAKLPDGWVGSQPDVHETLTGVILQAIFLLPNGSSVINNYLKCSLTLCTIINIAVIRRRQAVRSFTRPIRWIKRKWSKKDCNEFCLPRWDKPWIVISGNQSKVLISEHHILQWRMWNAR